MPARQEGLSGRRRTLGQLQPVRGLLPEDGLVRDPSGEEAREAKQIVHVRRAAVGLREVPAEAGEQGAAFED